MIILNIDRSSDAPLFRQVFGQIRSFIERGSLKPGDRLPPTRVLAARLGLHRATVYRAYQELWAHGYLESRPGSYSVVRDRVGVVALGDRLGRSAVPWGSAASHFIADMCRGFETYMSDREIAGRPEVIDMASLDLDERLFPVDRFRRCMSRILCRDGVMFTYGDPFGYRPLREFIARRLQLHGISVTPDEILITNGAQNGIDLILKVLTVPGSRVVVESPTYSQVIPLLRFYRAEIVAVPVGGDGLDLDRLEAALREGPAALLYTMPDFHNPTGVTTSQQHREALLAICERHRLPVVEDAFEEEMKYFGRVTLPIKSMDKSRIVLYLGTFSKVLFPGIRIGWIAADGECIRRLAAVKRYSDLSTSTFVQAVLAEFCEDGGYELHVRGMHRVYRRRMQAALAALREFMPAGTVTWREPLGGYLIWLRIGGVPLSGGKLQRAMLDGGVFVAAGTQCFPHRGGGSFVRISISSLDEGEITEGIRLLGKTISRLTKRKV